MSDCRRTHGLISRLVADRLSTDDRAHAPACGSCGPVLARAFAFDEQLRRSARALVIERLPPGVLEATLAGRPAMLVTARRPAPGFATILTAIAILVAATVIAVGPGASPVPGPTPSALPTESPAKTRAALVERFRSTDVIRAQLAKVQYRCNDGGTLPSPNSEPDAVARDAAVCVAPESIGPISAAVIVGETAAGQVVQITIKGDLLGGDTSENRAVLTDIVATTIALSLLDEGAGQGGAAWARVHVPQLEVGGRVDVTLRSVMFHAELGEKGYFVTVRGVRTS